MTNKKTAAFRRLIFLMNYLENSDLNEMNLVQTW